MNPAQEDARLKVRKINEWLAEESVKPEQYIADEVISFDAEYGRIGLIWIGKQDCVACHIKKQCLVVDQSEGEYTQATICFECVDILRKANL